MINTPPKRRPAITDYPAIKLDSQKIERIEIYRTKRSNRLLFWQPKYVEHILALTRSGTYEIFPPEHKPHPPLFGEVK